jgi:hypothetical protein
MQRETLRKLVPPINPLLEAVVFVIERKVRTRQLIKQTSLPTCLERPKIELYQFYRKLIVKCCSCFNRGFIKINLYLKYFALHYVCNEIYRK